MKQVAQAVHGGGTRVVETPVPALRPGGVLVRTAFSLVSPGTERMIVDLAGKSLVGKARSRPDQVRKVFAKIRTDGVLPVLAAVRARLEGEMPLGYSAAGRVVAVGEGVGDLRVGQEVACAGAGYACHAEVLFVPRNLVAPVPRGLPLRHAAAATLGAIALQGVRRAEVVIGERVGVVGLGLLGLITVQILRSAGCRVLAFDLDPARTALAKELGAEIALMPGEGDAAEIARGFGGGHGLDAVIVTAASESSEPAILAARLCRLGGRVVIVGAVGMDLPRNLFYERELDLRLARSYGPGRYDPAYEERGLDYPYPYVRFTEGRNLEDFLALLGRGEVDVAPLLTHEYGIEEGEAAYDFLMGEEGRSALGLLFHYPAADEGAPGDAARRVELAARRRPRPAELGVALVGAGAFARSVLLPALRAAPGVVPTGVVTATGLSGISAGRAGSFQYATTRFEDVLADEATAAVVIAVRHREHARLAAAALRAGKDVFVEKPLALTREELAEVEAAVAETGRLLFVGFNRRFAPAAQAFRDAFRGRSGPLQMVYRINAGPLPPEHWTRDREEGGGRILGEVCHFADFLGFLAGASPEEVAAAALPEDGVTATIRYADGSVGTILYSVNGDPALGKERIEAFAGGTSAVLDNFRRVEIASGGRVRRRKFSSGKGHREEIRAFVEACRTGKPSPLPAAAAAESTRATFAILESVARGGPVRPGDA